MLTNQAYASIGGVFAHYDQTTGNASNWKRVYYATTDGSWHYQDADLSGRVWNEAKLRVGGGVTPVSKKDYKLENQYNSLTYTKTSTFTNYNYNSNLDYLTIKTVTVTNNTDSIYTITEIGLLGYLYANYTGKETLLAREIIEPIILNPGDTYTFTMKIKQKERIICY